MTRSQGLRLRRQPRVGGFTADSAVIVSDLPTRTFKDGPLHGSFRQTYHARKHASGFSWSPESTEGANNKGFRRTRVSGGSIAPTAGWRALDSLTSLSRERVRYVSDTELLHKSKGEPVRRLEIFTGSGRRRVWTSEQKAEILAESYESGDKVSAVARRHGLTPQQLFGWRRNAQRRVVRRRGASTAAGSVSFAQVMVEAPAPSAAASCAIPCATIEIALGAAVVRVSPGIDVATLTKVLRAVKAAT